MVSKQSSDIDHSAILGQLNVPVLVVDGTLVVEYLNTAAEVLLHISARRAVGRQLASLSPIGSQLQKTGQRALERTEAITERALCLAGSAGDVRFDSSFVPLPAHGGLLIELIPVNWCFDVAGTESRIQQQTALQALLRNLAHEIRNPLGGLRGAAQLLQRALDRTDLREYTQVIIAEADRLSTLLEHFQNPPSKPLAGTVNIHLALERVYQLIMARHGPQLKLVRDYDPSIPEIRGNLDRLVQGFLNLANNACEAEADEIVIRTRIRRNVTLGNLLSGPAAAVEIGDNGHGISAALQALVFYPFVSGRSNGNGLGLSIAQSIAVEHGGLIQCDSEPGATVFTWFLPLVNACD